MPTNLPRVFLKCYTDDNFFQIPTGITEGTKAQAGLVVLKINPGYRIANQTIQNWHFEGIRSQRKEIFFTAPARSGRFLYEIMEMKPEAGMVYLNDLAQALLLLKAQEFEPFYFQLDSVFFSDTKEVYFFPPEIMNKIRQSRNESYRVQMHEVINHPYEKGSTRWVYALTALVYRMCTGTWPYNGTTESKIRDQIRNLKPQAPSLINPALNQTVSDTLVKILLNPALFTTADILALFSGGNQTDLFHQVSEVERQNIREQAQKNQKKQELYYGFRMFLEKNLRTMIFSAVIVVIVLSIVIPILANIFKPRSTAGFTPEQVVQTYYESITKLDLETLADTYVNKAGETVYTEVLGTFMQQRQRLANEQKNFTYNAARWAEAGKPPVYYPYFVFGITDLVIEPLTVPSGPAFMATYNKWSINIELYRVHSERDMDGGLTAEQSQQQDKKVYSGLHIQEKLFLRLDKKDWVIDKIELVSEAPIHD